jgi:hypothetical protein
MRGQELISTDFVHPTPIRSACADDPLIDSGNRLKYLRGYAVDRKRSRLRWRVERHQK